MNRKPQELLPLLALAATFVHPVISTGASAPSNLLPIPAEVQWEKGKMRLDGRFSTRMDGPSDPRVTTALLRMVRRLEKMTGTQFPRALQPSPATASLTLHWLQPGNSVQTLEEDESYSLQVTSQHAQLSAANPIGILRGVETFLQLIRREGRIYTIPAVSIRDRPRFRWRGILIDAARHWQPVEVIKRNLDGMAAVKMNVLHWHLTDDQGFRVESKKFPELHAMGSDGKYYTQQQILEILDYARERGIRVVPEFDMPGHVTSWLVGHPELASAPGPYQIERTFGIKDPALDPTREEVYKFLDEFLGEMAALFPDAYLHIGGDEVNGKQWDENPAIQAFMKGHQLRTHHDLQAYFNLRLSKIITSLNKKMVGWDEIFHSDLPKTTVIHSWRGPKSLVESARQGYDGILSYGYYLDHILPAAYHYRIDPIPPGSGLTPEEMTHILGGEAAMWTEFVSDETIDSRIWPRAAAVAERLWSSPSVTDEADLHRRLEFISQELDLLGVKHVANYEPMLQRLIGNQSIYNLTVLADVVEPVKYLTRPNFRPYDTQTPLDRLVDAARPESDTAWKFREKVDSFLSNSPKIGSPKQLTEQLQLWQKNHQVLVPMFTKSERSAEIVPLSENLAAVAEVGLKAVGFLRSKKSAPRSWTEEANQVLDKAQIPRCEVEIAIIPGVRKLVLAADQWNRLRDLSVQEWNLELDRQVEAARAGKRN